MCCLVAALLLFGPRVVIFLWWLFDMARWERAFDSFIVPAIGFIFLPWTTLMFVAVAPRGDVVGADWLWLAIALLIDIASYGSGYRGRQARMA